MTSGTNGLRPPEQNSGPSATKFVGPSAGLHPPLRTWDLRLQQTQDPRHVEAGGRLGGAKPSFWRRSQSCPM